MALQALQEECRRFLHLGVENLVQCLRLCDAADSDDYVFQLCSYWLQNSTDAHVTDTIAAAWPHIATYKFLPLVYQLAAR